MTQFYVIRGTKTKPDLSVEEALQNLREAHAEVVKAHAALERAQTATVMVAEHAESTKKKSDHDALLSVGLPLPQPY